MPEYNMGTNIICIVPKEKVREENIKKKLKLVEQMKKDAGYPC
jgi:hypothetical protein